MLGIISKSSKLDDVICRSNAAGVYLRLAPFAAVALLAATLALPGCTGGDNNSGQRRQHAKKAVPVAVKTVQPGTVNIFATYPGRIHGAREVEVRSRVEGILLARHYNQGAFVKKGQLLFTINPKPFRANLKQRQAKLVKAKAKRHQAQQVWMRVSALYQANAVSEAERDKAHAQLKTSQAAVALAQAHVESAQIKLDYAHVEAPMNGVTSLEEVDVGALVTHGTLLTTITQLDPVHVRFAITAEDALMRQKALAAADHSEGTGRQREATLILPSGNVYAETGFVDFTQSTIDPRTGTVRLRAVFDNKDHQLVPGRFVSVRIRLATRHNTIVVPKKAIADSQTQTQVLVVTDANKAKAVPVQLGPVVAGGRIIDHGLEAGDRVIVIGLGQVKPGDKVAVKPRDKLALGSGHSKKSGADSAAQQTSRSDSGPAQGQTRPAPAAGADKQDN